MSQAHDDHSGSALDSWFTPRRFAFLLALLVVVAFHDVLIFGQSFFFRDFTVFGYPLAYYHRESFWNGEVPLWNPYNNCGLPFLAQWNTLTFYPLSLVYLLLPMPWAVSVFCVLHLFLAGLGMYFLAREWTGNTFAAAFAGIVFAFNGLMLNCLMWPNNMAAIGLMPWVIFLVQRALRDDNRRLLVFAALVSAAQMLSGAPEIILFTWMVILGLWLFQFSRKAAIRPRSLRRLAAIVFLTACLAAVQLLPFLDLLAHSQRSHGFANNQGTMGVWGWVNFVFPLFHFRPTDSGVYFQETQAWTSSYYVGAATLLLALLAVVSKQRKAVLLLAVAVLAIVVSLGDKGFLYGALRSILPQLGFLRFPIKFVVPAVFCFVMAGALGLSVLRKRGAGSRATIVLTVGLILLGAAVTWVSFRYPITEENWKLVGTNAAVRIIFLILFLGLVVIAGRVQRMSIRRIAAVAALIVIWLDAITHVPWQNPTVEPNVLKPKIAVSELQQPPQLGVSRAMLSWTALRFLFGTMWADPAGDVMARRLTFSSNCNLLDAVPKMDGFYSLYLEKQYAIYERLKPLAQKEKPQPLLDFLAVSHESNPTNIGEWVLRSSHLPVATIGQEPRFLNESNAMEMLFSGDFDPRRMVLLPTDVENKIPSWTGGKAAIVGANAEPHRLEFKTETEQPSLLVVSQSDYHAWKAYVDGQPTGIFRANLAFQAILIPAGSHNVVLRYEDVMFRAGSIISLASAMLCATLLIRKKGRHRIRPSG